MIKIEKNTVAPTILSSEKAIWAREKLQRMVESHIEVKSSDFDAGIYGCHFVKGQLKSNQYGKCAYCESSLAGDFASIDHYRPKTTVRQEKSSPRGLGYYWLAYDWDNLVVCCDMCNNRKNDLFPLKNPDTRNISNQDISSEEPLIINPSIDNPEDHLEFHQHIVMPKIIDSSEDERGKATIEILELNKRPDLLEARKRRWDEYRRLCKLMDSEQIREQYALSDKPYAGMFRANKYA